MPDEMHADWMAEAKCVLDFGGVCARPNHMKRDIPAANRTSVIRRSAGRAGRAHDIILDKFERSGNPRNITEYHSFTNVAGERKMVTRSLEWEYA